MKKLDCANCKSKDVCEDYSKGNESSNIEPECLFVPAWSRWDISDTIDIIEAFLLIIKIPLMLLAFYIASLLITNEKVLNFIGYCVIFPLTIVSVIIQENLLLWIKSLLCNKNTVYK